MSTPSKKNMHFNHTTVPEPNLARNVLHNHFFGIIDRARHVQVWRPEEGDLDGINKHIFQDELRREWFELLSPGEALCLVGRDWVYTHSSMKGQVPLLRDVHNGNPALAVVKLMDTEFKPYLVFIGRTAGKQRYAVYSWYPDQPADLKLERWDATDFEIHQILETTDGLVKRWAEARSPYITLAARQLPNGQVISLWRANRHHNVNWYALDHKKITKKTEDRGEQGFVDQFGKFYNRHDAWDVAVANKQIVRDQRIYMNRGKPELYSEHLF